MLCGRVHLADEVHEGLPARGLPVAEGALLPRDHIDGSQGEACGELAALGHPDDFLHDVHDGARVLSLPRVLDQEFDHVLHREAYTGGGG